jgi:hypothetical protein
VSVKLFLKDPASSSKSGQTGSSYMVVEDQGCGMDEKGLKDFATYSLDKETRKQQNDEFISKFGVGAKQSGFFLGDRIRVITSPIASSDVNELILDESVFEDRYQKGEQVFTASVYKRALGDTQVHAPADEKQNALMMETIRTFEKEKGGHFTMIVIRLRDKIVRDLYSKNRFMEVPYELAQIYHFHLHPNNKPDEILSNFEALPFLKDRIKDKAASPLYEAAKPLSTPRSTSSSSSSSSSASASSSASTQTATKGATGGADKPLQLSFYMYEGSAVGTQPRVCLSLNGLKDDDMKEYLHGAGSVFRCNLSFPDPNTDSGGGSSGGVRAGKKVTMQCLFFYYPYVSKETRPRPKKRQVKTSLRDIDATKGWTNTAPIELDLDGKEKGMQYNVESASDDSDDDDKYDGEEDHDPDAIDVFWVNRLVPQTTMRNLPFIPKANGVQQCEQHQISVKWHERIKGFVFLDHSWDNISNNKLKIQVDPDLDTYINDRVRPDDITYMPKNAVPTFMSWLKACTQFLDKEAYFNNRLFDEEKLCRSQMGSDFNSALFSTLNIGNDVKLQIGDQIKLFTAKDGKKVTKRDYILAEITAFDVDLLSMRQGLNPDNIVDYYGRGRVRYLRLPKEMYHPAIAGKKKQDYKELSKADLYDSTKLMVTTAAISPENYKVNKSELEQLLEGRPEEVELFLCETSDGKHRPLNPNEEIEIEASMPYYKLGVRILNTNGRYCVYRPGNKGTSKDMYKASIFLTKRGNGQDVVHAYGSHADYWCYDKAAKGDVKEAKADSLHEKDTKKVKGHPLISFYGKNKRKGEEYMPTLTFDTIGSFDLVVEVETSVGGDQIDNCYTTYPIKVKSQPVSYFDVEWMPDSDGACPLSLDHELGSPLPNFKLVFKDKEGNIATGDHGMYLRVNITSKDCVACVVNNGVPDENPLYILEEADNGCFVFEKRGNDVPDWFTMPKVRIKGEKPLLSENKVKHKDVEWSVQVFLSDGIGGSNSNGMPPHVSTGSQSSQNELTNWSNYTVPLGTAQTFKTRYIPAKPASLVLLDPSLVKVENDNKLPTLTFAAFDAWGNRTGPLMDEFWRVKALDLESLVRNQRGCVYGLSGKEDLVEDINKAGEVQFKHLKLNYSGEIPSDGATVPIEFKMFRARTSGKKIDKVSVDKELQRKHPDAPDSIACLQEMHGVKVDVLVLPREFPTSIEVLYEGEPLPVNMCFPVGSTVSDLSFRVLREDGEPLQEFRESWLEGTNCGVLARGEKSQPWAETGASGKDPWKHAILFDTAQSTPALPDIKLPRYVETFSYEVTLRLAGDVHVGPYQFAITTQPKEAVKWRVQETGLLHEGIKSGSEDDLSRAVQAVVLVDNSGNVVPWNEKLHPVPQLSWVFVNSNDNSVPAASPALVVSPAAKKKKESAPASSSHSRKRSRGDRGGDGEEETGGEDDDDEEDVDDEAEPVIFPTPLDDNAGGSRPLHLEAGVYLEPAFNIRTMAKASSQSVVALSSTQLATKGGGGVDKEERANFKSRGVACFVLQPGQSIRLPRRTRPLSSDSALAVASRDVQLTVSSTGTSGGRSSSKGSGKRKATVDIGVTSPSTKIAPGLLAPHTVKCRVDPGKIHAVLIECAPLGVPKAVSDASVELNRYMETEVTVFLVDQDGHPGSLPQKMKRPRFSMIAGDGEDVTGVTGVVRKLPSNGPPFVAKMSMPQLREFIDSASGRAPKVKKMSPTRANSSTPDPRLTFSFSCGFEAEVDGKVIQMVPAELSVSLQHINAVSSLRMTTMESSSNDRVCVGASSQGTAMQIYCDTIMPKICIDVLLEDGSRCTPPLDSLDVRLSLSTGRAAVPTTSPIRGKAKAVVKGDIKLAEDIYYFPLQIEDNRVIAVPNPEADVDMPADPEERQEWLETHPDHLQNRPPFDCGTYTFSVGYTEKNPTLIEVLPESDQEVESEIRFEVVPRPCMALQGPIDHFASLAACNFADASVVDRMVVKTSFKVWGSDPYGNRANLPLGARVCCFLARDVVVGEGGGEEGAQHLAVQIFSDTVPANVKAARRSMPALKGSDEKGLLWGKLGDDLSFVVFPGLELQSGVGEGDGTVDIVFACDTSEVMAESVTQPSQDGVGSITPWVRSFTFETDATRMEAANKISEALKPLRANVESFCSEKMRVGSEQEVLKAEVRALLQKDFKGRGNLNKFCSNERTQSSQTARLHVDQLLKTRDQLQAHVQHMEGIECREPKKDPRMRQITPDADVVGYVLDLGYVDGDREAEICSHMAARHIGSLVVKNRATAQDWYAKKVKSWPLDLMQSFQFYPVGQSGGKPRKRTDAERASGSLPLEKIKANGNPEFLVNLIRLREENEHLRDTVFWGVFKKSLLFDSMATATAYREKEIKAGRSVSTIVTRTGDIITADGVLDPNAKIPNKSGLRMIFGQLPPAEDRDVANARKDIESIDKMVVLLRALETLTGELERVLEREDEIIDMEAEIRKLEGNLGGGGGRSSSSSSSGGGAGRRRPTNSRNRDAVGW